MPTQDHEEHLTIFKRLDELDKSVSRIQGGIGVCAVLAVGICAYVIVQLSEISNVKENIIEVQTLMRSLSTDVKKHDAAEILRAQKVDDLQEKVIRLEVKLEGR